MHRTAAEGHDGNLYTEGNPTLSVPATVVDADAANSWQEELCNIVEEVGTALASPGADTYGQVVEAIKELYKRGGRPAAIAQTIANNQASAADVTDFPQFLTSAVRSVEFLFDIRRRTDSSNVVEAGRVYLTWNPETSAWVVSKLTVHDASGVEFVVTLVSGSTYKLQYTSDSISGSSYTGTMKITDVKTVLV